MLSVKKCRSYLPPPPKGLHYMQPHFLYLDFFCLLIYFRFCQVANETGSYLHTWDLYRNLWLGSADWQIDWTWEGAGSSQSFQRSYHSLAVGLALSAAAAFSLGSCSVLFYSPSWKNTACEKHLRWMFNCGVGATKQDAMACRKDTDDCLHKCGLGGATAAHYVYV